MKKINTIDLSKKASVDKIVNAESKSIKEELLKKNSGLDLILVGDLTTSMTHYHTLLKNKFKELAVALFPLIENLRIGIIFYLDHGSGDPYITSICQPTTNIQTLKDFIYRTSTGGGGDSDEAVEDALNDLLQNIQWKELHTRSVVLFGDARPHTCNYCPYGYDFWKITKQLYYNKTTINTVFCRLYSNENMQDIYPIEIGDFDSRLEHLGDAQFFSWIANVTGGMTLGIENIDDLLDIIITYAAKDAGKLDDLESKIKSEPRKLNLVKIAKKALNRKLNSTNQRKLLE